MTNYFKHINKLIFVLFFTIGYLSIYAQTKVKENSLAFAHSGDQIKFENAFFEGITNYEKENWNKAQNSFEKSIEINNNFGSSYFYLSKINLKHDNLDKAIDNLNNAITKDPKNLWYKKELADLYKSFSDFENEYTILNDLLKIDNSDYSTNYNLFINFRNRNKQDESLKLNEKIAKKFGLNSTLILDKIHLLENLKLNKKLSKNILLFNRLFPDDIHLLFNDTKAKSLYTFCITNKEIPNPIKEKIINNSFKNNSSTDFNINLLKTYLQTNKATHIKEEYLNKIKSENKTDSITEEQELIKNAKELKNSLSFEKIINYYLKLNDTKNSIYWSLEMINNFSFEPNAYLLTSKAYLLAKDYVKAKEYLEEGEDYITTEKELKKEFNFIHEKIKNKQ